MSKITANPFPEFMVFKTGTGPNDNKHYYAGQEKDALALMNDQYNADNDTSF